MSSELYIDFVYICNPMVKSLSPYRTSRTMPVKTTWAEFKAEWNVKHAIKREWPAYAWPGGYPLYYITADSGVLCPECANKNLRLTLGDDPQWQIVACEINYEEECLTCDNCYTVIKPAYGHGY
jgi:hypothetical protein